jgi:hypothetical protein
MSLSLLLKLMILPFYMLLPFSLGWSDSAAQWYVPFLVWLLLILVNALAEYLRSRN